jgi:hypothetical protein
VYQRLGHGPVSNMQSRVSKERCTRKRTGQAERFEVGVNYTHQSGMIKKNRVNLRWSKAIEHKQEQDKPKYGVCSLHREFRRCEEQRKEGDMARNR